MDSRDHVDPPEAGPLEVETDERSARADWRSSIVGSTLLVALAGAWLAASPSALEYEREALPIVCGAVIVAIALVRVLAAPGSRTLAIVQIGAGALAVIAAFAAAETAGPTANMALMGAAVVVLTLAGLGAASEAAAQSRG